MRFRHLVASVHAINRKKTDLLLIMPCFNEYDVLMRHLSILSHQTCQDFNLLLVLGAKFEEKKLLSHIHKANYKFGVIACRRKSDTGSAGGFFTGQKYALENGYSYAILADCDCFPQDRSLIETLYYHRKENYVSPHEVFKGEDGRRFIPDAKSLPAYIPPTHYSFFSTVLFRKYGLIFAPIYTGADDAEYAERIREKRTFIASTVCHPLTIGDKTFRRPDRFWAYTLNTLCLIKDKRRLALNLSRLAFSALAMFLFYPKHGRSLSIRIISNLITFTYGKPAFEGLKADYGDYVMKEAELDSPCKKASYPEIIVSVPALAKKTAGELAANFRKNVKIECSSSDLLVTLMSLSAKKLYYRTGKGQYLLIADNKCAALHIAKLLAFAAILPFFLLALLAIFIPSKIIRQPKTLGFGLD